MKKYLGFGNINATQVGDELLLDYWDVGNNNFLEVKEVAGSFSLQADSDEAAGAARVGANSIFIVVQPDNDIVFYWDGNIAHYLCNVYRMEQKFFCDRCPATLRHIVEEGGEGWLEKVQLYGEVILHEVFKGPLLPYKYQWLSGKSEEEVLDIAIKLGKKQAGRIDGLLLISVKRLRDFVSKYM